MLRHAYTKFFRCFQHANGLHIRSRKDRCWTFRLGEQVQRGQFSPIPVPLGYEDELRLEKLTRLPQSPVQADQPVISLVKSEIPFNLSIDEANATMTMLNKTPHRLVSAFHVIHNQRGKQRAVSINQHDRHP